jgi:hypothetical protein
LRCRESFFLIYFLISQTVFSSDGIQQRNGIGQTVNYQYSDVQRVELGGGRSDVINPQDGHILCDPKPAICVASRSV